MLSAEGSNILTCWTSVHYDEILERGKNSLPSAPWEPNRVPVPKRSLGPTHWSDPDAAGVCRDSRGAWRPRSALIDRGQELGVTFLDSRFVLYSRSYSSVFYVPCWDGVELSKEQTALRFKSGSLPHLCWVFNKLFLQSQAQTLTAVYRYRETDFI